MTELKLLLSIAFLILIIIIEILRKKTVRFDFFGYFVFYFLLMYLLPYISWILSSDNDVWIGYKYGAESGLSLMVLPSIAASYFLVYFGFIIGSINGGQTIYADYPLSPKLHQLHALTIVLTLIFTAVVASHGGVLEYLLAGILSRSGEADLGLGGYFGYFLTSIEFLSYMWLGLFIFKGSKLYGILFAVCFFSSILVSLSSGSRAAVIYPVLFLLFFVFGISNKIINIKMLTFVFGIILFGSYSISEVGILYYDFSRQTNLSEAREFNLLNALLSIPGYFKHYLITIERSVSDPLAYQSPRLWVDYFRAVASIVPGFNWSNGSLDYIGYTKTIAELNRVYMDGNGYVPAGWIASTLINGSFVGLVIQSLVAGFVGGLLNKCFLHRVRMGIFPLNYAISLIIMTIWYRVFFPQDPWQVFLPNVGILIIALTAISSIKFRISK